MGMMRWYIAVDGHLFVFVYDGGCERGRSEGVSEGGVRECFDLQKGIWGTAE